MTFVTITCYFFKKSPVYYIDVIAGYGSYNVTTYIIKKIKRKG